jgi:hypothetical protein
MSGKANRVLSFGLVSSTNKNRKLATQTKKKSHEDDHTQANSGTNSGLWSEGAIKNAPPSESQSTQPHAVTTACKASSSKSPFSSGSLVKREKSFLEVITGRQNPLQASGRCVRNHYLDE